MDFSQDFHSFVSNLSKIQLTIVVLVVYTVILNVFFLIKRSSQCAVNCWFCNHNTLVPRSQRNAFECPSCDQYNGFTKDGDYNRVIHAQYAAAMNCQQKTRLCSTSTSFTNGLCRACNRNLSFKVTQLAMYEPMNANNYDEEIEHFERQLDKTYTICQQCQTHLTATLRRQNSAMFGHAVKSQRTIVKQPNPTSIICFILTLLLAIGLAVNLPRSVTLPVNQYVTVLSTVTAVSCPTMFIDILTSINGLAKFNRFLAWLLVILTDFAQCPRTVTVTVLMALLVGGYARNLRMSNVKVVQEKVINDSASNDLIEMTAVKSASFDRLKSPFLSTQFDRSFARMGLRDDKRPFSPSLYAVRSRRNFFDTSSMHNRNNSSSDSSSGFKSMADFDSLFI